MYSDATSTLNGSCNSLAMASEQWNSEWMRSSVAPFGSNPRLRAGLPQLAACSVCRDRCLRSSGTSEAATVEVFGRIGSCGRHVCQRLRAGPKLLALTVRLRASARAKRPRLSPSMQEQAVLCTAYVHTAWPIVRCRNVSVFAIDASARMVVSAMFCRSWLNALYLMEWSLPPAGLRRLALGNFRLCRRSTRAPQLNGALGPRQRDPAAAACARLRVHQGIGRAGL